MWFTFKVMRFELLAKLEMGKNALWSNIYVGSWGCSILETRRNLLTDFSSDWSTEEFWGRTWEKKNLLILHFENKVKKSRMYFMFLMGPGPRRGDVETEEEEEVLKTKWKCRVKMSQKKRKKYSTLLWIYPLYPQYFNFFLKYKKTPLLWSNSTVISPFWFPQHFHFILNSYTLFSNYPKAIFLWCPRTVFSTFWLYSQYFHLILHTSALPPRHFDFFSLGHLHLTVDIST